METIILHSSDGENVVPKKSATPKRSRKQKQNNCSVTPPKQKCLSKINSNSNEKNVTELSPKTLLSKLDLGSPNYSENKSPAKKLFDTVDDKFQNARKALHSSAPSSMPGREKELEDINNFIKDNISNNTSGTLYISGPPGTGKTAALSKILTNLKKKLSYKEVYVNCTSVKSAGTIFSRIAKEIGITITGRSEKDYLAGIECYLSSKNETILLVLDEIDQLDSRKQSVLYSIFEWPLKTNFRIVLIGIANALDFTDRTLPRLQSHLTVKPKLLYFAPYNKQQIVDIFMDRLKASNVSDVFPPAALQMLAGKVAAVSGDVRRALDISRRAIELADQTKIKQVLHPTEESNYQDTKVAKTVDLKQVMNVLNNVYGTCQNLQEDVDDSFPLQQKLLICSLILMLKKGKKKDILVGKLHEVYKKICVKRNILAVDRSEFVGMCSLIETRGIIKIQGRKEPQLNKVCLEWDEDEVSDVLKDKQLLSSIIQDESVIGK